MRRLLVLFVIVFFLPMAYAGTRPRVRTVTAFVNIDRATYRQTMNDALKMLRAAQAQYKNAGYEVQTIRITTQPFADYTRGLPETEAIKFLQALDQVAETEKFTCNIGPVNLAGHEASFDLAAKVLAQTHHLQASSHIATATGIDWEAVRSTARIVKYLEEHSPQGEANFSFAATAFLPAYGPFYPGSWHNSAGKRFSVGLESANIVNDVFSAASTDPQTKNQQLRSALAKEAKAVEDIALRIAAGSKWEYVGIDPTPAPGLDASIGAAIESYSGTALGGSGTLTAAFAITDAVRSIPVKHAGYSGLMLPVLEDRRIAQRWSEGALSMDSLLSYSSVCATGLDTIPLPGDVTEEQLTRIIGDVATLAFKWKKPLSARLQPVPGKKPGETSEFKNPFLMNATIQKLP